MTELNEKQKKIGESLKAHYEKGKAKLLEVAEKVKEKVTKKDK